MSSVWIRTRTTKSGARRHHVQFRIGGREASAQHGGSFPTKTLALRRAAYIAGELAAMRVPDLTLIAPTRTAAPPLREVAEAWRASRVDVAETTASVHRSAIARIFELKPDLATRPVDEITVEDVASLVAALCEAGYRRGTVGKTRDALAMALDFHGVEPNVARDGRVKLPRERKAHVPPPLAGHVERVCTALPRHHVLPLLVIDAAGPRVNELATAKVGDLDETRRAIRVRTENEKNERFRHLELPEILFDALLATLPPREDRDLDASLFPDLTDARLRTAITKACRATGTPHFSPHGLRRRRGSLHYHRTSSLTAVADLLGDSKRVASEHYVYGLTSYDEVDHAAALSRA